MEFDFDISQSLPDTITKVDNTLNPFNRQLDVTSRKRLQQNLIVIIDRMGMASAKAQSLKGAITTAAKLGISDHRLYILKETEVNRGLGKVVGILKVGKKKLFVVDYTGTQHECLPLCVLDFYVHESQQRTGNGKLLFEYMLKAENVTPSHLAIDRPSFKFLSFLQKHYGLRDTLPKQVNNFVVFEDLFNLIRKKKLGGITQHQPTSLKPPIPPTGRRYFNRQEHTWHPSTSTNALSGLGNTSLFTEKPPKNQTSLSMEMHGNIQSNTLAINSRPDQNSANIGLSAQANMYSRYGSSLPNIFNKSTQRRDHGNRNDRMNSTRSAHGKINFQNFERKEADVSGTRNIGNRTAPSKLTGTGNYTVSSILNENSYLKNNDSFKNLFNYTTNYDNFKRNR